MARHFKPVGTSAVKILARLAARKIIADQLRDQLGVRVSLVPVHEINAQAQEYLANHPELFTLALERAKRMGWVDLREPMTTPDHPRSEQNS
jgi:hypothetical protein